VGTSVLVTALLAVIRTTAPARADDEARPVASVTRAAAPRPATQPGEAAAPDRVEPPAAVAQQEIDQARPKELTPDVRASLEAARTSYEATLATTPDNVETLNKLGQTLAQLNHQQEALAAFERAVALAPADVRSHVNLARTAAALGNGGRAAEQYGEA